MEMNGLVVDYDGDKNVVMYHGLKEYPIGGMIAEYTRLHPISLKNVILDYQKINEIPLNEDMAAFFPWFVDELEIRFGTISAIMITFDFMEIVAAMLNSDDNSMNELFVEIAEEDTVGQFIFENSGYSRTGNSTNRQLLLSAYYWWAHYFVAFKHSFSMLASEKKYEERQIQAFWSMFAENIDFQHIDFRIANFEGKFHSLYTIKSSMSLLLFETAHCIDKNVKFIKCANCGEYFVPEGRIDAIYCNYPSPQDQGKRCKDIGAQVTRANKEKNDIATKEYRKVYMRYKMMTIRHPENLKAKRTLEKLMSEVKVWRKKLNAGIVTTEEFLEWLDTF